MLSNFALVKNSLWLALTATISFAIINELTIPLLVLIVCLSIAIIYWLASHREILQKKYTVAEANSAIPSTYDKTIYGHKPRLRELAPWIAAMGLLSFWFAYMAAHGNPLYRVEKLIHQFIGVSGVVIFWTVLGVSMLAKGIEIIIGNRSAE